MSTKNYLNIVLTCIILFSSILLPAQVSEPILRPITRMHTLSVIDISSDANGKYILSVSDDKTAKLWDAESGKLLQTIRPPIGPGKEGMLYTGAISPDAKYIAFSGWTSDTIEDIYSLFIYDLESREIIQRIGGFNLLQLKLVQTHTNLCKPVEISI